PGHLRDRRSREELLVPLVGVREDRLLSLRAGVPGQDALDQAERLRLVADRVERARRASARLWVGLRGRGGRGAGGGWAGSGCARGGGDGDEQHGRADRRGGEEKPGKDHGDLRGARHRLTRPARMGTMAAWAGPPVTTAFVPSRQTSI